MCAIKLTHTATSSANWQELTGVHQLLYFAHLPIALVYSVAEYCVPVWGRCAHVQHVDTQLNITMRTVSGALRPTNINWLPVLSNIEPPHICRDRATLQVCKKAQQLTDRVPTKEILCEPPKSCLRSRRPFVAEAARLASLNQMEQQTWEQSWIEGVPPGYDVVTNPTCRLSKSSAMWPG